MSNWDFASTAKEREKADRARDIRERNKNPEKHYKRLIICKVKTYYEERNLKPPNFCKGELWTNHSTRVTCCTDCSYAWHDIKYRLHKQVKRKQEAEK